MFSMQGPSTPQSLDASSPSSFSSSRQSTPSSYDDASATGMASPAASSPGSIVIKKESDKKPPVKKRKSWGQTLPTPTTNLPPRKRAKTSEEKEQRRVERVLRNRAAAQKSREVKKQQLEHIELERDQLKEQNEAMLHELEMLRSRVRAFEAGLIPTDATNAATTTSPSPILHLPTPSSEESIFHFDNFGLDTLNPTDLMNTGDNNNSHLNNTPLSPLCMTHQPAALMCDLPCQQTGTTTIAVSLAILIFSNIFSTRCLTDSRNANLISHTLPRTLLSALLTLCWTASLTVTLVPLCQAVFRAVILVRSSIILAHLRIATDCSSKQLMTCRAPLSECASILSRWRSNLKSGTSMMTSLVRRVEFVSEHRRTGAASTIRW